MEELALALVTSSTIQQAAGRIGISEITARRWLRTEQYLEQFFEIHRPRMGSIVKVLRALCIAANEALAQVLADPKTPAQAKVSAAKAVHNGVARFMEIEDFEQRLTQLEQIANAGEENS